MQREQEEKVRAQAAPLFNGGKMQHLFQKDPKTRFYLPEFADETVGNALKAGEATLSIKIDGSCGAMIWEEESLSWVLYNRYDDTKGRFKGKPLPEDHIPLPEGGNVADREGHSYSLRRLLRPEGGGKPKGEVVWTTDLYRRIRYMDEKQLKALPRYNSIELVGKNYNRTPGVVGNNIALHSAQVLDKAPPALDTAKEWMAWMMQYLAPDLKSLRHEGLVVGYKGRWWKVRADNFAELAKLPKAYLPPVVLLTDSPLDEQ